MGFLKKFLNFFKEKNNSTFNYNLGEKNNFLYRSSFGEINYLNGDNLYIKNPVVFRAINLLCSNISSIPLISIKKDLKQNTETKINDFHPLNKIIENPNNTIHCHEFLEKIVYNLVVFGNVFLLKIKYNNEPRELYILDQSKVSILSNNGYVYGYKFFDSNGEKEYIIDEISGDCDIFHLKNTILNNSFYGSPSLEPIYEYINYHNNIIHWNNMLIQNGARPSGAFFVKDDKNFNNFLSEKQMNELKIAIDDLLYNNKNFGQPMIVNAPLEWKELSIRPKDIDFLIADQIIIKHISNALGIPKQLLGETNDSVSYNNFLEAKKMLYELTIIPILRKILCNIYNNWLCRDFNNSKYKFYVTFNEDEIPILSYKKNDKLESLRNNNFMTINEKRKEIGLESIEGGDTII